MIRINLARNKEGFIQSFTVSGHAGYEKKGKDIVCAAVSVTAYTAVGALEELAGLEDFYREDNGYMACTIPDPANLPPGKKKIIYIIMETTAIGFKQIENSYRKYVSLLEEEV